MSNRNGLNTSIEKQLTHHLMTLETVTVRLCKAPLIRVTRMWQLTKMAYQITEPRTPETRSQIAWTWREIAHSEFIDATDKELQSSREKYILFPKFLFTIGGEISIVMFQWNTKYRTLLWLHHIKVNVSRWIQRNGLSLRYKWKSRRKNYWKNFCIFPLQRSRPQSACSADEATKRAFNIILNGFGTRQEPQIRRMTYFMSCGKYKSKFKTTP